MKVIVCGAGRVGTSIAKQLASEDNNVIMIDSSAEAIASIGNLLDVTTMVGVPSHPNVLEEAGASNAEMIIAVTPSDEVNMIICELAHSIFNVPIKVARIRSQNYLLPAYKDLYRHDHVPIDHIISPEKEVASAIINRLHVPGAMDTIPLVGRQIKVVEVRCLDNCPVIGYSIASILENNTDLKMNIIGIFRDENLIVPNPSEKIRTGDEVYFIADRNDVPQTMHIFGHKEKEARKVIIVGGGNIGLSIAEAIEADHHGIRATLIELSKERAELVASKLENTIVINGNSLEQEILLEANVGATETIIAVTNDDEANILSCLLAKRLGCQRAFSLINKGSSYSSLITSLGIDATINPREMTVSSILQHARKGRVRAAYSICEGMAEIIEAEAIPHGGIVGKSVGDLGLPLGIRIGAIRRGNETIMSTDKTIIAEGDSVIILSLTSQVKKVDKIFSSRMDYF